MGNKAEVKLKDINDMVNLTQYYSLYSTALAIVQNDPSEMKPEKKEQYDEMVLAFNRAAFSLPYELARPSYVVLSEFGFVEKQWIYERDNSWAIENKLNGTLNEKELEVKLFEARMEHVNRLRESVPETVENYKNSSNKSSDVISCMGLYETLRNTMDPVLRNNEGITADKLGIDMGSM